MEILLSASNKHFDPIKKEVKIRHSVGVLVELFSKAIEPLGHVTYISDTDQVQGKNFDLIISWPRNFSYLTRHNTYKKSICFFNIAEANYLARVLRPEAERLGCKLSDCFTPKDYYRADLNFLIGNDTVKQQYIDAGVDPNKIVQVFYRHGYIPFVPKRKNNIPVFLHIATSLGLRKGFWHVVNDFKACSMDAKLVCIGKIQNERFWIDFAKEAAQDPRIEVVGWLDNNSQEYIDRIHQADFIVFPSFGEGQPGSVIEAMEGGCLPMTTIESGITYHPFGILKRGDTLLWRRAFEMHGNEYHYKINQMKTYMDYYYNNIKFENTIREEVIKLMQ